MEAKFSQTQLLTAKQFGQKLNLSKRSIHRLNACGQIPKPLKIGGSIRWNEQEVSAWISAGCLDRKRFEQLMRKG